MGRGWTPALALLALLLTAADAEAQEPSTPSAGNRVEQSRAPDAHPAWRSGLVWTLGVGEPYGWLGGDLAYYVPLRGARMAFAPHAALGRMPPGHDLSWEWGARGGVTLMFGRADRALVDVAYGAVGAGPVVLHGAAVAGRVVEGVTLLGGYEWMWRSGVLIRVWGGPAFITEELYPEDERIDLVLGIGVGWKPW